jgi:hypothetical protein
MDVRLTVETPPLLAAEVDGKIVAELRAVAGIVLDGEPFPQPTMSATQAPATDRTNGTTTSFLGNRMADTLVLELLSAKEILRQTAVPFGTSLA